MAVVLDEGVKDEVVEVVLDDVFGVDDRSELGFCVLFGEGDLGLWY